MLADNAGVQLSSCSAQTETTSGRTVEQPPPPINRADKGDCTREVAPTRTPQQDEAGSNATDIAMVDPEIEKVADEEARADPQEDEPPRDDLPKERSTEDADLGVIR